MIHDVGCSEPSPQPNREGILRCPSCKFTAPVPKPLTLAFTGYVCRDHHTQPVRFPSGKGCTLCPKRKPKARKKIQSSDPSERQYLT